MANTKLKRAGAIGFLLLLALSASYYLWRPGQAPPIIGIVRTTEVRIAPEVGGQLAAIKVRKGDRVRAGDVVAELSALELTASVDQARAALAAARADRDHVYAGVREEEVASLAAGIDKAKARLEYAGLQHARAASLVRSNTASPQSLDQAVNDLAAARADVAEAEANHAAAQAGPTAEQRAIADAQVQLATTVLGVLERRLDKTTLRAPADGIVTVVVAEVGEAIRAGQPVLVVEETGGRWLSFNVREDFLEGLAIGVRVEVARAGLTTTTPARVTELTPIGVFATWQAERAVGDHDRNTLHLRLDLRRDVSIFEPGMTVRMSRISESR
jgi:HlyD family secretion protein